MNARIVVTGAGVISPLAAAREPFERAMFDGACGISPSGLFEGAFTAGIVDFVPQTWLGNKGIRALDRTAHLLCVAARMALAEAGLEGRSTELELGLVCGTVFGGLESIVAFDWSGLTDGPNLVSPMDFANTVINSPAGQAAIMHKLRGVNSTVSAGLASGLHALNYAADFLRFGRGSILLAGGVEELREHSVVGFERLGLCSVSRAIRPFGRERDGSIPGEGSLLWVLETDENARQRGVTPCFEIAGFGTSFDAHSIRDYDMSADGAVAAILMALKNAAIESDSVACIVASANGSPSGDAMEARALRRVFGPRLGDIPVCAPKAALGEAMGASGAYAAHIAGCALQRQSLPPTVHGDAPDFGIRLSDKPQPVHGNYALVNAFGCDGNNAAMILKLWTN